MDVIVCRQWKCDGPILSIPVMKDAVGEIEGYLCPVCAQEYRGEIRVGLEVGFWYPTSRIGPDGKQLARASYWICERCSYESGADDPAATLSPEKSVEDCIWPYLRGEYIDRCDKKTREQVLARYERLGWTYAYYE